MELTRELLEKLGRMTPGNTAVYRVQGEAVETVYSSALLPGLLGMDEAEYFRRTEGNALNLTLPSDRGSVLEALQSCIAQESQTETYYRVYHGTQGFLWVHARASFCGYLEGSPVLFILFAGAPMESDIYQDILNHTDRSIFICDCRTRELLYVNEEAVKRRKSRGQMLPENTCYAYIQGRDTPCGDCVLCRENEAGMLCQRRYDPTRNVWEQITGRHVRWCGHDAFVHYIEDITEMQRRQEQLRIALNAESQQLRIHQLLNAGGSLEQRLQTVLEALGNNFHADRTYVFSLDEGGETVSNAQEWCREGVTPEMENLQKIDLSYIDCWMPAFQRHQLVSQPDITEMRESFPTFYEEMTRQNIHGYLEAPLVTDENFYGFIGVDNPSEEAFEQSELLLSVAYAVSSTMERTKNEQKLLDSQRRYQLAVEGGGIGVWEYDIQARRAVSPSHSFRGLGFTDVIENVPEAILPLILDKDKPKMAAMLMRVEAGEASVQEDFWIQWREDVPPQCEHIVNTVVKDENGVPRIAYGIGMNVTAQKQEEERYRTACRQLEEAHPASLGSFHLNLSKNWCGGGKSPLPFVLKQQESGTADGYFAECSKLIADEDVKALFHQKFNRRRLLWEFQKGQTRETIQYPIVYPDGSRHWREGQLYLLRNPVTRDVEAVTYAVDIDEQKKNELITQRITGENFDYIALVNPGTLTMELRCGNGERLLGERTGSFRYDAAYQYVAETQAAPEDREHYLSVVTLPVVCEALNRDGRYAFSYKCTRDGQTELRSIRYCWLEKPGGLILMTSTDVTAAYQQERKQAERLRVALLEAKHANAMKTEFLSNVSHDIRTPLNAVLGYAGLAKRAETPEEKDAFLEKIQRAGDLLRSLINNTLDLSKIETGAVTLKPVAIDSVEILNRVVAAVKPAMDKKRIRLEVDATCAAADTVRVDALRVQEIFMNLLSNAVKFTPDGGTITLRIASTEVEPNALHVQVTVQDTGCGMSREFLPKLFDPFTQERIRENADAGGSGLGLSIVRRLVDLMGGTIEVESQLGQGTTFVVTLDLERTSEKPEKYAADGPTPGSLEGKRILLLEDNAMNTEIARALLEAGGMTVVCAENGEVGVRIFRESAPRFFDAVLMDIRMPVLDGYGATRAIRELPREDARAIPILAMTADAFEEDEQKCLDAGMNAHLTKPIDPKRLYAALDDACGD